MLKPLFARIAMIVIAGLWASFSHAQIRNDVFVSGTFGSTPVQAMDDEFVAVITADPRVVLVKTIDEVQDTNGSGRVDAGDTVIYRFEVINTGNQTLVQIDLADPLANLLNSTVGPLAPAQSDATLTATYTLTLSDMDLGGVENSATAEATPPDDIFGDPQTPVTDVSDAGDELVETPALDGTTDGNPTNDPTVLEIEQIFELDVEKDLIATAQPFPFVFDLTYLISVENTGNVTANNIGLDDNVVSQFAPNIVMQASVQNPTGIATPADLNAAYDGGITDTALFSTGLSMAPAEVFTVEITVRVEVPPGTFSDGEVTLPNQAFATFDNSASPTQSANNGEIGPVLTAFEDADLDGVIDSEETAMVDRDGDGIMDAEDIDPTGYFYCEEDGTILTGGMISVSAQSGNPADIRIVQDGSTGMYQWYVVANGTYEMTYTVPPSGVPSVVHLSGGALQLSSLGGDYVSLGSNENLATGTLADFTATANPYHLIFEIAEGDPHILNNNIPLRHCGTPALTVAKSVVAEPTAQDDGRLEMTYGFTVNSTGNSRAADIGLTDALDPVFGVGRYEVVSVDLVSAPSTYSGTANPSYDGSTDTQLLTSGGYLDPDETLTVELALLVDPLQTGTFENTVTVTGAEVISGAALPEAEGSVSVLLVVDDLADELLISKTANPENVIVGDVVTYTIEVENTSNVDLAGINLIDQLPVGIQYRAGTALIDGLPDEPDANALRLAWDNFVIASGQTRVLTLQSLVGPQAGPGDIVNEAWIENALTGERLTRVARATVRIAIEPVFDCSTVIGKVFEDRNLNGYQDPPADLSGAITDQTYYGDKGEREILEEQQEFGEPGIPNVNVITPTGTVITTDEFGRFSVPCAELPDVAGTNFSLKIDERTLPTGYHVVTENPRTLRLTAGIFAEMNFGAALGDVIEIDLTAEAFNADGTPVAGLENSLRQLHTQVGSTHTLIRLGYYYRSEGAAVARQRLDSVEALFAQIWQPTGAGSLAIERSVYNAQ